MVQLVEGTPLFSEIFDGRSPLTQVDSKFPTYAMLENGFLSEANRKILMETDSLQGKQVHDVQQGMRYLVEGLALYSPIRPTGIPSMLLPGLKDVVQSLSAPTSLSEFEVVNTVMNANSPKQAAGAFIGAALGALGISVPVVGTIAVAVVGLALGIFRAMQAAEAAKQLGLAQRRAIQYRYFPPLQKGGADIDSQLAEEVRTVVETHDWTRLYLPRWHGEWHGQERNDPESGQGGFVFGPGKASGSIKFDASAGEDFIATGGLGCIPGTDQITDLIQVSLPHDPTHDPGIAQDFWTFMRGGPDPRVQDSQGVYGKSRVIDTGSFYPLTARLCGMMWNFALQRGNPMKFRIDTRVLEAKWRTYCESGLEYIRKVCYPWAQQNQYNADFPKKAKKGEPPPRFYLYDPNANLEGYFGTAVFYAIGAFSCLRNGLLDNPPSYKLAPPPYGVLGRDIARVRGYGQLNTPVFSNYSGAWLPIIEPAHWPDQCMGTRWDRGPLPISQALADLRMRQLWDLRHSATAVATCRRADAAFVADPDLEDELLKNRAILLEHNARHGVNLADIAPEEPGIPGKPGTWREQLVAAGVNPMNKFMLMDISLGDDKEPVPPPPPFFGGNPDPWNPGPPVKEGTLALPGAGAGLTTWLAVGGTITAGAFATWWFMRRRSAAGAFNKELVPWLSR